MSILFARYLSRFSAFIRTFSPNRQQASDSIARCVAIFLIYAVVISTSVSLGAMPLGAGRNLDASARFGHGVPAFTGGQAAWVGGWSRPERNGRTARGGSVAITADGCVSFDSIARPEPAYADSCRSGSRGATCRRLSVCSGFECTRCVLNFGKHLNYHFLQCRRRVQR